ncbi:MAG: hypothetical protein JJ902_04135 [Roseibium sp.]|nr:hypothetical protein [Roseibium sp.]
MPKRQVADAVVNLLEVMSDNEEVVIMARLKPEQMDELAAAGAEDEDEEDGHDLEADKHY